MCALIAAHTGDEAEAFLHELPFDLRCSVGSIEVHLVHGAPRKVNEYLLEDKPDGDRRGAFAVLDESAGELNVSIERVAYDADAVARQVRAAGLPGEYADKLLVAA